MKTKLATILVVFSIILLLGVSSVFFEEADAAKSVGTKNSITNSNEICGLTFCHEMLTIQEKINRYYYKIEPQKLRPTGVSQQQASPVTQDTITALEINGKYYDIGQFNSSQPDLCPYDHYHIAGFSATSFDGNIIYDDSECGVGHVASFPVVLVYFYPDGTFDVVGGTTDEDSLDLDLDWGSDDENYTPKSTTDDSSMSETGDNTGIFETYDDSDIDASIEIDNSNVFTEIDNDSLPDELEKWGDLGGLKEDDERYSTDNDNGYDPETWELDLPHESVPNPFNPFAEPKTVEESNGTRISTYDEYVEIIYPDQTRVVTNKDGDTYTEYEDGTIEWVHSEFSKFPYGNWISKTTYPEGKTVTVYSDGRTVTVEKDGSTSTVTENKDGSTTFEFSDGEKRIEHKDGSITTIHPNGTPGVKDGTKITVFPEGHSTEVWPDGTTFTITKDGTVIPPSGGEPYTDPGVTGRDPPSGISGIDEIAGEKLGETKENKTDDSSKSSEEIDEPQVHVDIADPDINAEDTEYTPQVNVDITDPDINAEDTEYTPQVNVDIADPDINAEETENYDATKLGLIDAPPAGPLIQLPDGTWVPLNEDEYGPIDELEQHLFDYPFSGEEDESTMIQLPDGTWGVAPFIPQELDDLDEYDDGMHCIDVIVNGINFGSACDDAGNDELDLINSDLTTDSTDGVASVAPITGSTIIADIPEKKNPITNLGVMNTSNPCDKHKHHTDITITDTVKVGDNITPNSWQGVEIQKVIDFLRSVHRDPNDPCDGKYEKWAALIQKWLDNHDFEYEKNDGSASTEIGNDISLDPGIFAGAYSPNSRGADLSNSSQFGMMFALAGTLIHEMVHATEQSGAYIAWSNTFATGTPHEIEGWLTSIDVMDDLLIDMSHKCTMTSDAKQKLLCLKQLKGALNNKINKVQVWNTDKSKEYKGDQIDPVLVSTLEKWQKILDSKIKTMESSQSSTSSSDSYGSEDHQKLISIENKIMDSTQQQLDAINKQKQQANEQPKSGIKTDTKDNSVTKLNDSTPKIPLDVDTSPDAGLPSDTLPQSKLTHTTINVLDDTVDFGIHYPVKTPTGNGINVIDPCITFTGKGTPGEIIRIWVHEGGVLNSTIVEPFPLETTVKYDGTWEATFEPCLKSGYYDVGISVWSKDGLDQTKVWDELPIVVDTTPDGSVLKGLVSTWNLTAINIRDGDDPRDTPKPIIFGEEIDLDKWYAYVFVASFREESNKEKQEVTIPTRLEAMKDFRESGYEVIVVPNAKPQDVADALKLENTKALWITAHGGNWVNKTYVHAPMMGLDGGMVVPYNSTTHVKIGSDNLNQVTFHACGQDLPQWRAVFPGASFFGWNRVVYATEILDWQVENNYPEIDQSTGKEIGATNFSSVSETGGSSGKRVPLCDVGCIDGSCELAEHDMYESQSKTESMDNLVPGEKNIVTAPQINMEITDSDVNREIPTGINTDTTTGTIVIGESKKECDYGKIFEDENVMYDGEWRMDKGGYGYVLKNKVTGTMYYFDNKPCHLIKIVEGDGDDPRDTPPPIISGEELLSGGNWYAGVFIGNIDGVDEDLIFKTVAEAISDFEQAGYLVKYYGKTEREAIIDFVADDRAKALWFIGHSVKDNYWGPIPIGPAEPIIEAAQGRFDELTADPTINKKSSKKFSDGRIVEKRKLLTSSHLNQVTFHSCGQDLPAWHAAFPGAKYDSWIQYARPALIWWDQMYITYPEIDPETGREVGIAQDPNITKLQNALLHNTKGDSCGCASCLADSDYTDFSALAKMYDELTSLDLSDYPELEEKIKELIEYLRLKLLALDLQRHEEKQKIKDGGGDVLPNDTPTVDDSTPKINEKKPYTGQTVTRSPEKPPKEKDGDDGDDPRDVGKPLDPAADLKTTVTRTTNYNVQPGGTSSFIVKYNNLGPNDAANVSMTINVTDSFLRFVFPPFPANISNIDITSSVGLALGAVPNTCTPGPSTITCNIVAFKKGDFATIEFDLDIARQARSGNLLTITSNISATTPVDPNPVNNKDSRMTLIKFGGPIEVIKTDHDINEENLIPGDILQYEIEITNNDQENSTVDYRELNELEDPIPSNTSYVANSLYIDDIQNSDDPKDGIGYDSQNNMIIWNGMIPSESTMTVKFQVTVDDKVQSSIISNQAVFDQKITQEPSDDPDTIPDDDPTISEITVTYPLQRDDVEQYFSNTKNNVLIKSTNNLPTSLINSDDLSESNISNEVIDIITLDNWTSIVKYKQIPTIEITKFSEDSLSKLKEIFNRYQQN